MSTKAELLEQMSLAAGRVAERPSWMKEMLSQARQAERYVTERDNRASLDSVAPMAVTEPRQR